MMPGSQVLVINEKSKWKSQAGVVQSIDGDKVEVKMDAIPDGDLVTFKPADLRVLV